MRRRSLNAGWTVAAVTVLATLVTAQPGPGASRQVAVTFDDLPGVSAARSDVEQFQQVTTELVASIVKHRVPAIGFVNEGKLAPTGEIEPARVALLQQWLEAGLELGNHSYSHLDLHSTPVERFIDDVSRGEVVTRKLMADAGKRIRYFRHPFLRTGRDAATRTRFDAFLEQRGYAVAPVTIDHYDYMFAAAYDRQVAASNSGGAEKVVAAYLSYMGDVLSYYEQQSRALLGRELPQVLLLHANALNARTFDSLARMMAARGYQFVGLDEALKDSAYHSRDEYYGTAGITWLHRWALTQGKRGAFFAGEPTVPSWVEAAAILRPGESTGSQQVAARSTSDRATR